MALGRSSNLSSFFYWMDLQRFCGQCASCWLFMVTLLCFCRRNVLLLWTKLIKWRIYIDITYHSHSCSSLGIMTQHFLNLEKLGSCWRLLISENQKRLWRFYFLDYFSSCCFSSSSSSCLGHIISSVCCDRLLKLRIWLRVCGICILDSRFLFWVNGRLSTSCL